MIEFVGHFHPVLVHLPIGILLLAGLFELPLFKESNPCKAVIPLLLLLGCISAIASALCGWVLSLSGVYEEDILNQHKLFGILLCVFSLLLWGLKRWLLQWKYQNICTTVLNLLMLFSLVLAGHLGGSLTHGSDFLNPFAKPNPSDHVGVTNVQHTLDTANAEIYKDVINPIFTAKCVQCHGKTKQKGNLAMYDFEQLLQGGKSGKVVLSGDALKSELIHRVFMDKDDKKHMPPLGKDQLLKSEVDIIFWWIQHGMDNREKVSAVLSSDTVRAYFASMPKIPQLDLGNVPQVSKDTIALVTQQGFVVNPIYKGSNFVDISAVNAATAGDNQAKILKLIATQIAWLDISNTKISDASMVDISTFTHLVRLNIRNNQIADQSINQINQLVHLEVLNIVGTKITDAGLLQLAKLPALKKIYCSNTAITKEGIAAFAQTKPLVEIIGAEQNNQ